MLIVKEGKGTENFNGPHGTANYVYFCRSKFMVQE